MHNHIKALEIFHNGTVIPATPLALDKNRNLDEQGLRVLMRYYLDCGVGGIATAVHTTQFAIRDNGMFEPVLKVVSEEIDSYENKTGKTIVKIAGACGKVDQAVAEAEIAKQFGYDAVLVSPGGLGYLTEDELIERTKAVAKIMPVVGFYLQTACGGRAFTYNYWERICEIPNVIGIKAAPFNRYYTLDVVRAATLSSRRDEIALYTGNDDNIVMDLLSKYKFEKDGKAYCSEFVGGLLGHWSVWTKKAVELFELTRAEKKKEHISPEMLSLASAVTDTNSAFFDTANNFKGCIAGLHEVLRHQGLMDCTYCIDPNEAMSSGQLSEIKRVYKMYPNLNDDAFVKENIHLWRK